MSHSSSAPSDRRRLRPIPWRCSARIADALERIAPPARLQADFDGRRRLRVARGRAAAFPGAQGEPGRDGPAARNRPGSRHPGRRTPQRFAKGLPANNALLWGARGMGKSSLVKAVHAEINQLREPQARAAQADRDPPRGHRDPAGPDGASCAPDPHRFIIFCDDLSFDADDTSYKSLKAVLEGGIEGRPENVIFYATSNRRHLMPRDMMDNERSTAINPGEAVEEKVSLSDRFGLWLGFHKCSQDEYLDMVFAYVGPSRPRRRPRRHPRRGAGMGDDPRRALRPHRLAVHPGSRRADGQGDLSRSTIARWRHARA